MDRNESLVSAGLKIIDAADQAKIPARLLGGLAVYLTCPSTRQAPFQRDIADIDFIVAKRRSGDFGKLLANDGYLGDHQFNSIHGETRLLFTSELTDVDVFVGAFQQCHALDLESVLQTLPTTIPLAHLLLTKLQIVEINRKDQLDALAILADHQVTRGGGPQDIDLDVIASIAANDWGWYTTMDDNLAKLQDVVAEATSGELATRLQGRLTDIRSAIHDAPKSMKWKMRDKVGRRVPWYDLPEEKRL